MTIRHGLRKFLGLQTRPAGNTWLRSSRPSLEALEDRLAPAHNITIAAGGTALLSDPGLRSFSDTGDYTLDPAQFQSATAEVIFQANNDVQFLSDVSLTEGVRLTALAGRSIVVGANVGTTRANLSLKANVPVADGVLGTNRAAGDGALVVIGGSQVTSGGGSILLSGEGGDAPYPHAPVVLGLGASVRSGGGPVTVNGHGTSTSKVGIDLDGATVDGGSTGAVRLSGMGGPADSDVSGSAHGVYAHGGARVTGGTVAIAGNAGAGNGTSNIGIYIKDINSHISSEGGDVTLTGTGGEDAFSFGGNRGVRLISGGVVTAGGMGRVSITGTGGTGPNSTGVDLNGAGSRIASAGGDVSVRGTGGASAANSTVGVIVSGGSSVTAGGLGEVTVTGVGGAGGGNFHYGVYLDSLITSGGGDVSVEGTGGGTATSANAYGVFLTSGGMLTAGGMGNVRVAGTAGAGNGNATYGVHVKDPSSQITSNGGDVSVTGTGGGSGSSSLNHGVALRLGGVVTAGGTGRVSVLGTGGATGGDHNHGVFVEGTDSRITSGGGAVVVNGVGGGSGGSGANIGVFISTNAQITAGATGSVSVSGRGGTTDGHGNYGVQISNRITSNGGHVTVSGWGGGSGFSQTNIGVVGTGVVMAGGTGTVTVLGTGGPGSGNDNHGVNLTGMTITSSGGDVTVDGTGGGTGVSSGNAGVYMHRGGRLTAGGTGKVAVTGQGGATTGNGNFGVLVSNTLTLGSTAPQTQISSSGGDVTVRGTGGGTGLSANNSGIYLFSGGLVTAGGLGEVTVSGIGGAGGGNSNHGVILDPNGQVTAITSNGGDVSVTGIGGGSGASTSNVGVLINPLCQVTAGGTGRVEVSGTGGVTGGTGNHGVFLAGSSARIGAAGALSVHGAGDSSSVGVLVSSPLLSSVAQIGANGTVTVSGSGGLGVSVEGSGRIASAGTPITIYADSMALSGTDSINADTGTVTLTVRTPGTAIDLGSDRDNAAGTLELSSAELGRVTAGTALQIGDDAAGGIRVSNTIGVRPLGFQGADTLTLRSGAAITATTGAALRVNRLSLQAGTGIGAADASLATGVNSLVARTASGGIFLSESDDLTFGFVVAPVAGLQVTGTSGDIRVTAGGNLKVDRTGDMVRGPGDITLAATGTGLLTLTQDITGTGASGRTVTLSGAGGVVVRGATVRNATGLGLHVAIAGTGSAVSNAGIDVDGATIDGGTSGNVTLNGTGGPALPHEIFITLPGGQREFLPGPFGQAYGVHVHNGAALTTGGSVAITATGGGSDDSVQNHGLLVTGVGSRIAGSVVQLSGNGGAGTSNNGIRLVSGGRVTAGGATGNLALRPGSQVRVALTPQNTASSGFAFVHVEGTVDLGGTNLLPAAAGTLLTNATYTLLKNDGADANGLFAALSEGSTLDVGGRSYALTYRGGDGNDVVLTAAPIEVTAQVSVVRSGLTYNRADGLFNGSLTLTNKSASSIAGTLMVVFQGLRSGVTLRSATVTVNGVTVVLPVTTTVAGDPVVRIPRTVLASLAPGQTVRLALKFSNPLFAATSYTCRIYSDSANP